MINNLYYGSDNADIDRFRNASFKFDTDVLATFLRRIYNGFDTSNDVEPTMWREILRIINEATVDGLVQGNYDTNIDKTFLEKLAHSNEVFSAFKVHNMGVDMAKKMRTDEGKLKPFSEWKKDIKSIASHYCGAWLQTEYNTATLRAKFAAEWKQYEADADIMPNLRWMPTTSANPEEEHKVYWMNRLTLPVGDKFWDKHHPGDHWNCKCSLEQTDEPANPDVLSHIPDVKAQKGLAANPGKTGEMFDKEHPYISSLSKQEQEDVLAALEDIKNAQESYIGNRPNETIEELKKRLGEDTPITLEHLDEIEKLGAKKATEEETKDFADKMHSLFERADFGMNVPRLNGLGEDVIDAIFSEGRFCNQLETTTSMGANVPQGRADASHDFFGTEIPPNATSTFDKTVELGKKLEKYGLLMDKDILTQANSPIGKQYWKDGDGMQVRFKKEKVLTTFTVGDSWDSAVRGSLTSSPKPYASKDFMDDILSTSKKDIDAMSVFDFEKKFCYTGEYVEIQYHGELTTDCIESVYIPETTWNKLQPTTKKKIMATGCKIYSDKTESDGTKSVIML